MTEAAGHPGLAREAAIATAVDDRSLKLLSVTKSTGGLAQFNRRLMAALAEVGVESHTLCLSEEGEAYADSLGALGLSAETLPMNRYQIDLAGDVRLFRRTLGIVRARRPDVILSHGSKPGMIARAAGRITGTPVAHRQASLPFIRRVQGSRAPIYWAMEVAARGLGGHVVTLSHRSRDVTLKLRVASAEKTTVIHTGIDVERFRNRGRRDAVLDRLGLDPARPTIGWMGRFEPQKAPGDFATALAIVAREHPEIQAITAGEGALEREFRAQIDAAGLSDRVRIMPWQSDVGELLEAFDIFALTSRWEGLPISLLEAMGCGAAPVVTAVDGTVEAVEDGVSGLLVPPGEPAAMAAALGRLIVDPALRARLSGGARERVVTRFEIGRWLAEWRELLFGLARRPPAAAPRGAEA